jgi:flagellar basal-body rod protein FlgC
MDLFRAFDISASGLSAQRARMEVIAENIANAETTATPGGGAYRRKAVLLQSVDGRVFPAFLRPPGVPEGTVQVTGVIETADPMRRVHEPAHPQAGPDGFVDFPNVNPLVEMIDMLATTRAYEANATAFQAAKTMGAKLLEILR